MWGSVHTMFSDYIQQDLLNCSPLMYAKLAYKTSRHLLPFKKANVLGSDSLRTHSMYILGELSSVITECITYDNEKNLG